MNYHDGSQIALGDVVTVPLPTGTERARVVMLGASYEHLDIDPQFVAWVERERVLEPAQIVIEWLDRNPLAHTDPQYAPVGNFMFTEPDEDIVHAA